ncbi:MAG: hypothetical protein CMP20_04180 [Rickettsiales bacterium]|nr:hypothetical protein [Rickettsiales bacterium]
MTKDLPAEISTPKNDDLPAYLQGNTYDVQDDNFDSSDVVLPRIKLLQGISPEIEQFEAAKIGCFWHSGADKNLGDEIEFVIADRRKKYLLSAPLEDGQGILARADDAKKWDQTGEWQVKLKGVKKPVTWKITDLEVAKSGVVDWGSSNPEDEDSSPAATLFYDYLVFLPEHLDLGPAIISLSRSSIRKAKKGLNDKIEMHRSNGRPMQAAKFKASSVSESSPSGDFKNWQFMSAGFNTDEDLFNTAREHIGALQTVRIGDEADTDDGSAAGGTVDDGKGDF